MKNLDLLMDVANTVERDGLDLWMACFRVDDDKRPTKFVDRTTCGTTGCLLGWCPAVGEGALRTDKVISMYEGYTWDQYCLDTFDIDVMSSNDEWNFLFNSDWSDRIGHAKLRIQYLIDHGKVPADFEECEYTWREDDA